MRQSCPGRIEKRRISAMVGGPYDGFYESKNAEIKAARVPQKGLPERAEPGNPSLVRVCNVRI